MDLGGCELVPMMQSVGHLKAAIGMDTAHCPEVGLDAVVCIRISALHDEDVTRRRHHPELLASMLFVNVPATFSRVFSLVRPAFDRRTAAKVSVFAEHAEGIRLLCSG